MISLTSVIAYVTIAQFRARGIIYLIRNPLATIAPGADVEDLLRRQLLEQEKEYVRLGETVLPRTVLNQWGSRFS
jgi:hypothetical protein